MKDIKNTFKILSEMSIKDFEKSCYSNVEELLSEVLQKKSLKEKEEILKNIDKEKIENNKDNENRRI